MIPVVGKDLLTLDPSDGGGVLYPYLAQRLASILEVPGDRLSPGDELNDVACRYLSKNPDREQRFYAGLRQVAAESGAIGVPRPLVQLAEIPAFRLFVSTTFDSNLERALNQVRFGGAARTRVLAFRLDKTREENDLPADDAGDATTVYHLLGKLAVGVRYAVTQWDMVEFFHTLQSVKQPPLLFDSLKSHSLLILGSQFGAWLARFFLRMAKGEIGPMSQKADFIADPQLGEDTSLALFIQHLKPSIEIFPDGGAVEFVAELSRRWSERFPDYQPPVRSDFTKLLPVPVKGSTGAVFLSYASEDITAASKIKDALESAGVEVFFDKAGLQAGENWDAKLRRKIKESSLFLSVVSRQSLTPGPRFFKLERNLALDRALSFSDEETFLVPVVIDDTGIDAPGVPERFRAVQWERLPGGEATASFTARVQNLYRKYQRSVAAGVS